MQKKPPQEFIERQTHQPFHVRRIAPPEHDLPVLQSYQAVIGDGHPVRVSAEIAYRVLGPAERSFGIVQVALSSIGLFVAHGLNPSRIQLHS
jgi:hypothetical protein